MYKVKVFGREINNWKTIKTEFNEACSKCGYLLSTYHDCPAWHISWIPTKEELNDYNKSLVEYMELLTKN